MVQSIDWNAMQPLKRTGNSKCTIVGQAPGFTFKGKSKM